MGFEFIKKSYFEKSCDLEDEEGFDKSQIKIIHNIMWWTHVTSSLKIP